MALRSDMLMLSCYVYQATINSRKPVCSDILLHTKQMTKKGRKFSLEYIGEGV
jgi:hypothetical protein